MLALDKLGEQWTGKNMHYVRERIGTQLLQIIRKQKELVVALPLCDLKQPADAVKPCLLDSVDQPASLRLSTNHQENRDMSIEKTA